MPASFKNNETSSYMYVEFMAYQLCFHGHKTNVTALLSSQLLLKKKMPRLDQFSTDRRGADFPDQEVCYQRV